MILVTLLVAGCGGSSPTSASVPFRVIGVGSGFLAAPPGVRVIGDATTWNDFIGRAGLRAPSGDPRDPIPSVNFTSEAAVAIWPGQRPTTGYELDVQRVERTSGALVIYAVEHRPCVGATVITSPLIVIAVPKGPEHIDVAWAATPCRPS